MRDAGFSEQAIAVARAEAERTVLLEAFRPLPANQVAIQLFLALQTQWRTASRSTMARAEILCTGLDYGVVRETAALEALELDLPADFRRLRIMEGEALTAWGEAVKARQ